MRKLRKVLSIILAVSMVLGFSPVSVFAESLAESNVVISETADEPAGTDEQDPEEAVLTDKQADEEDKPSEEAPEETVAAAETSGEKEADEDAAQPDTMPAFSDSKTIDGVKVKVEAAEGTFPEGAVLDAAKVVKADKKAVEKAVEKTRDDNVNVAVSYTFDIKLLDKDGKEIQPADGKKVNISFETDEISDKNLTTDVYHISDEKGSLSAEALKITEKGDTVTAQTDGFSYYTVEFTYDEKQYVMNGDTTVSLNDILDYVGLSLLTLTAVTSPVSPT